MRKRRKRSNLEPGDTFSTLFMAFFGGACGFITVENTLPDLLETAGHKLNKLPAWRLHMGSGCAGIATFSLFLFFLELSRTKSRVASWRISSPWLPLVGLTLLASIVHISYFIVIPVGVLYNGWAYYLNSIARHQPREL
jgi:Na+-transporting NADH:ubiquinone oxidoreductase subunit NqrB